MLMAGGDSGDDHDARARFLLYLSIYLSPSLSFSLFLAGIAGARAAEKWAVSEHTGLAMMKPGGKVHF